MEIKYLDLNRIDDKIQSEIDVNINEVIKNKSFLPGNFVKKFEKLFTETQRLRYFTSCSSGTMALYLAGKLLNLQEGDEIICPAYSFIASVAPFTYFGAKPVFVDIDPITFTIDVNKIEEVITEKTKAIIAVHMYGHVCEMDEIQKIARKYNLKVIEDCAHAHFATYKGKMAGNFGDIAAFSFNPGKNLGAWGDAGGIAVQDIRLYEKVKKLIDHGRISKYEHEELGLNLRMAEIQGAVLSVKVKHLAKWTQQRRNWARIYNNVFLYNSNIRVLPSHFQRTHSYHIYPALVKHRDQVIEKVRAKGVDIKDQYSIPLHLQKAFKYLGYEEGNFPVTEMVAKNIITLPMYPEIKIDELNYVAQTLNEVTF